MALYWPSLMWLVSTATYGTVAVRPLFGMTWWKQYYVDKAPPFGLQLTSYTFTAITEVIQWIMTSPNGDDFLRH